MEKFIKWVIGSVLLGALMLPSCKPEPIEGEDRFTYVYTQEITNPPDDFVILFNNQSVGQKQTRITFSENAVWMVERIGDGRQSVSVTNDTGYLNIGFYDSIGFSGNYTYVVTVTNFLYGEAGNVFLGFKKLDLEYSGFEPKF